MFSCRLHSLYTIMVLYCLDRTCRPIQITPASDNQFQRYIVNTAHFHSFRKTLSCTRENGIPIAQLLSYVYITSTVYINIPKLIINLQPKQLTLLVAKHRLSTGAKLLLSGRPSLPVWRKNARLVSSTSDMGLLNCPHDLRDGYNYDSTSTRRPFDYFIKGH